MVPLSDHDLLQRIDERVTGLRKDMDDLSTRMGSCHDAIVKLRVESAKYGALAGLVTALLLALIAAGLESMRPSVGG